MTYMKTVCGLSLVATGEAPHGVNTLISNLREAKKGRGRKISLSVSECLKDVPLRMYTQGKRLAIKGTVGSFHQYHSYYRQRKEEGKKNNHQNHKCIGLWKNQTAAPINTIHFCSKCWYQYYHQDREIYSQFTQGINSITEKLHCKNDSCFQSQMPCLPISKCPNEENTNQVKCQSENYIC